MAACVYGVVKNETQAMRISERLRSGGFSNDDISILAPEPSGVRDLAHATSSKAPEGAAAGAGTGAVLGGAIGWLAGAGTLAIPGVGPLIAAGPILATLSGLAVGGAVGGLGGALIGAGIPEYEAQQYAGKLGKGHILMSVHVEDTAEADRVKSIMREENAEDISIGKEKPLPR